MGDAKRRKQLDPDCSKGHRNNSGLAISKHELSCYGIAQILVKQAHQMSEMLDKFKKECGDYPRYGTIEPNYKMPSGMKIPGVTRNTNETLLYCLRKNFKSRGIPTILIFTDSPEMQKAMDTTTVSFGNIWGIED